MRCVSPFYVRTVGAHVPCGKCNFCLSVKRSDWSFRLMNELHHTIGVSRFLTMTYKDEHLHYSPRYPYPVLHMRDMQLFLKRLRKMQAKFTKSKVRYYAVGEYGTKTFRPHYHMILFNVTPKVIVRLDDCWQKGHVNIGEVNSATIHYTTKYMINRYDYEGLEFKPFTMMSKRPGVGSKYLQTHMSWHRDALRNYVQLNGFKQRIPRYYREKLFNAHQRERLNAEAIRLADKNWITEIERLTRLHPDPANHYDERIMYAHDQVQKKAKEGLTL